MRVRAKLREKHLFQHLFFFIQYLLLSLEFINNISMEFSDIIKKEVEIRGISRYQLGQQMGKGQGWIYAVLGHNSPNLSVVQQFAKALGGKITLTIDDRVYDLSLSDEK